MDSSTGSVHHCVTVRLNPNWKLGKLSAPTNSLRINENSDNRVLATVPGPNYSSQEPALLNCKGESLIVTWILKLILKQPLEKVSCCFDKVTTWKGPDFFFPLDSWNTKCANYFELHSLISKEKWVSEHQSSKLSVHFHSKVWRCWGKW